MYMYTVMYTCTTVMHTCTTVIYMLAYIISSVVYSQAKGLKMNFFIQRILKYLIKHLL